MRRKIISIVLIVMTFVTFTSCSSVKNDDKATIQLWYYDYNNAAYYSDAVSAIITKAKLYCTANNIPLEIMGYNEDTISHEDYMLKRNVAAANGNMITIDDVRYLHEIAKQHADYSKLQNYNSLLNAYKDRFCIPLGAGYRALYIENEAIEYYGISTKEPLITYSDYLVVKQNMKEKGARFEFNTTEIDERIEYYLDMNGLLFINDESEILRDSNKFTELLKKSILEVCDDIVLYNDGIYKVENKSKKEFTGSYHIYDENSQLNLSGDIMLAYSLLDLGKFSSFREDIFNKTFYIDPDTTFLSPCFYMYKKITNNKIYDLANHIVSEPIYKIVTTDRPFYSPVFNTDKTKELLSLDNNWEYTGIYKNNADRGQEADKRVVELINSVYEMLVKNEDKAQKIGDYYFYNKTYSNQIKKFIGRIVSDLSEEKFDYKNEKANKMIDDKINEFMINFNVHHN